MFKIKRPWRIDSWIASVATLAMRNTTIVPYKPVGKGIPKMSKGLNISLWMHYLARISEPNNASHSQLETQWILYYFLHSLHSPNFKKSPSRRVSLNGSCSPFSNATPIFVRQYTQRHRLGVDSSERNCSKMQNLPLGSQRNCGPCL